MFRPRISTALAAMAITGLALAGCSKDPKAQPRSAADGANMSGRAGAGAPGQGASAGATAGSGSDNPYISPVSVDERIRTLCQLTTSHFDFDSANVSGQAGQALRSIADCFVSGPGKDAKGLRLVGHADERGETEYNMGLGSRRAGSVAKQLVSHGLPQSRITTKSEGERFATGTDEAGWAQDRKVDIFLAE